MESSAKHQLPSLEVLFKQSWTLFTQTFVKLLLLTLLVIGAYIVAAFIIGILAVVFGLSVYITHPTDILPTLMSPTILSVGGIVGLIIIAALVYIGILVQIATLKVVFAGNKDLSISQIITDSRPLIWPVFLVNLITGVLSFGGFVLLIVPGIVFSLLFSFAQYEVIFNHQHGIAALRRSFGLVATDFWGIFGRILLLAVLSAVATGLATSFAGRGGTPVLAFVLNTLISWYGLAYSLTIYKELLTAHPNLPGKNIKGIVLTSTVGLILFIVLLGFGINALVKYHDTLFEKKELNPQDQWSAGMMMRDIPQQPNKITPLHTKDFRFNQDSINTEGTY